MCNINEYFDMCCEILDDCGIPYGKVLEISVNSRAQRWGICRWTPEGFKIEVNRTLLDDRNGENGLVNTILHELLHTVPGCFNHGEAWKNCAEIVRRKYGYDIKRCSSEEEKDVTTGNLNRKNVVDKYVLRCENCGHEWRRKKWSKTCANVSRYRCPCGGKLHVYSLDDRIQVLSVSA